jgi:predicted NBD/HSP70 family sugar kinase
MTAIVGIDIGGSSQTAIAYGEQGEMVARADRSGTTSGGDDVLKSALRVLDDLRPLQVGAVGIGIPGQVDVETGEVRTAVNLGIGSEPYPLSTRLEDEIGCPVTVENDVRAAALGVYESRAPASVTLVNIGTGISAGVVIDGEIVRGAHGMAGEIGHLVMDPIGPDCRCGQRGCLEAIAAGPALARAWSDRGPGDLFQAAGDGRPEAVRTSRPIVEHLVTALLWLAATYDTEHMVIGGGVSLAGQPFLRAIRDEVAWRGRASEIAARRLRPDQVTLVGPEESPGPRGAWVLAKRDLKKRRESPASRKASRG